MDLFWDKLWALRPEACISTSLTTAAFKDEAIPPSSDQREEQLSCQG